MKLRDLIRFDATAEPDQGRTVLRAYIDHAPFESVGTHRLLPAILEATMAACTKELTQRFLAQHADTILAQLDPKLVGDTVMAEIGKRVVDLLALTLKESR